MNTVNVCATQNYPVYIGTHLLPQLGHYVASIIKPGKAAIISDNIVWALYGASVQSSLESAGFQTVSYIFPAGEASKNVSTYFSIVNFLAENHLTRADVVIALGGGVVGDITGFCAATFLRGIAYVQVPTTLLAMVDSSVGGKTAIDIPAGKNLIGAFYQPSMVLCDIDTLSTLSPDVFCDGCAEVIKYGVLFDKQLFSLLESEGLSFPREQVITRCVELKRDTVAADEFDTGIRQKLNLGHTVGHSIEMLSHFETSHGKAVAMGMAVVAKASVQLGICDPSTTDRILAVLERFSLPTTTHFTASELYIHALSDKKRSGSTVQLIVPHAIGNCVLRPTPVTELQSFIEAGL